MSPDYSNYSLQELYEAREAIDRESFPERYKLICALVNEKEANSGEIEKVSRKQFLRKVFFVKAVMGFCATFIVYKLSVAYRFGHITWKGGADYYLDSHPQGFYALVIVHLAFLIFSVFIVASDRWVKKPRS